MTQTVESIGFGKIIAFILFGILGFLSFGFVSDFDIRVSNLSDDNSDLVVKGINFKKTTKQGGWEHDPQRRIGHGKGKRRKSSRPTIYGLSGTLAAF
jgi:hypothetical protein